MLDLDNSQRHELELDDSNWKNVIKPKDDKMF